MEIWSPISVSSDSDSLSSFNVVDVLNFSSSSCNCVFLNCSTNKVSSKATNLDLPRGSFLSFLIDHQISTLWDPFLARNGVEYPLESFPSIYWRFDFPYFLFKMTTSIKLPRNDTKNINLRYLE